MKTKWAIAMSATVLICGAVYGKHSPATEQQVAVIVNTQESKIMETLLKDKKTYCIGNYTLELPEGMIVDEKTPPVVRFDDSNLVSKRMYSPAFEQRIRLREEELKQTTPINPQDGSYLKATYPLDNGIKGVIFESMESIGMPDSERILEAHFYKNNVAFILELKARNETAERYEAERKQYPELAGNNVPQKLSFLNKIISHINGREDGVSPSMSGLCMPNAFLSTAELDSLQQDIIITLVSKKYPQLSMILETRNYNPDNESLLSFRSYAEPIIQKSGGYVIKKGKKHINSLNVQEWLAKDNKKNDKEKFDFYLLINGQQASASKPTLFVNLMWEQNKDNQELSDAEILAIWDDITNTIKLY